MKVYVVTMKRWGGEESHNYVIGVYEHRFIAEWDGQMEKQRRDNKYEAVITEFEIDKRLLKDLRGPES